MVNGKPETVTVEIGISSNSDIEITSGLNEGDVVVTGTISTAATTRTTGATSIFGGGGGLGGVRTFSAGGGNVIRATTTGR
jgi:hypothetical protein